MLLSYINPSNCVLHQTVSFYPEQRLHIPLDFQIAQTLLQGLLDAHHRLPGVVRNLDSGNKVVMGWVGSDFLRFGSGNPQVQLYLLDKIVFIQLLSVEGLSFEEGQGVYLAGVGALEDFVLG